MTTPATSAGPAPSVKLLTLTEVAAHPASLYRSRGRVNGAVVDESLHGHRPPGHLAWRVPEVAVAIWAAGGTVEEQQAACGLCAARQPQTARAATRRRVQR